MRIQREIYKNILSNYSSTFPEQGGIIGQMQGRVVAYYHDSIDSPNYTQAIYIPNVDNLNRKILEWKNYGISFCGIIHNHPIGEYLLSEADKVFINEIFKMNDIKIPLYFPLILPEKTMIPYKAIKTKEELRIIKENLCIFI